jgi:hypothetical protein
MEKFKTGIPEKRYYTVELEAMVPAIIRYRILAETPEEALAQLDRTPPLERPKTKMQGMRKQVAKVYLWGTNMLQLIKRF